MPQILLLACVLILSNGCDYFSNSKITPCNHNKSGCCSPTCDSESEQYCCCFYCNPGKKGKCSASPSRRGVKSPNSQRSRKAPKSSSSSPKKCCNTDPAPNYYCSCCSNCSSNPCSSERASPSNNCPSCQSAATGSSRCSYRTSPKKS